jgi:hypothetical protein
MSEWKWNENKHVGEDGIDTDRTNGDRAMAGEAAVVEAAQVRGDPSQFDIDAVTDALADIGHLCDREGLDFNALVETAKLNWGMER